MSTLADPILANLRQVEAERTHRVLTPGLAAKVEAIKRYQQRRFALSYDDLLDSERHGPAARFFLEELYGPRDYSERDAQFAKVVPAVVRLFPRSVLDTVALLAALHALSERFDTAMGVSLSSTHVDASAYTLAWQRCGEPGERQRQIAMTVELGWSLDRLTRKPLLRGSLRMMRGPAQKAGLGELQRLLERGFDAFSAMRGASEFLTRVEEEERRLASWLFGAVATDLTAGRADRSLPSA